MKAWISRGKQVGRLAPLQSPRDFPAWYAEHVGPLPDDLLTLCATSVGAATNGQSDEEESPAAAAPLLDLEQAVIEVRQILGQDIQELKRSPSSDTRRGVLLRHVQKTSDSLCRLENTLAGLRREKRDALPWAVFESAIGDILARLVEIRKDFPKRIMSEIEALHCHRVSRVVRLIKEPLAAAIANVCEQDVRVLVSCSELRPVYEQMRQRARELEGLRAAVSVIPSNGGK